MTTLHHYRLRYSKLEKLELVVSEIAHSLMKVYADIPAEYSAAYGTMSHDMDLKIISHQNKYINLNLIFLKSSGRLSFNPDKMVSLPTTQENLNHLKTILKERTKGCWLARVIASQTGMDDKKLKEKLQAKIIQRGGKINLFDIHIHHAIVMDQKINFSDGIDGIICSLVGHEMTQKLLEMKLKKLSGRPKLGVKLKI